MTGNVLCNGGIVLCKSGSVTEGNLCQICQPKKEETPSKYAEGSTVQARILKIRRILTVQKDGLRKGLGLISYRVMS